MITVYMKVGHEKKAKMGDFATQAAADAEQAKHEQAAGSPPSYEIFQEGAEDTPAEATARKAADAKALRAQADALEGKK